MAKKCITLDQVSYSNIYIRILIVTLQFVLLRSVFFKHTGSTCNIRLWVAGCSSGIMTELRTQSLELLNFSMDSCHIKAISPW